MISHNNTANETENSNADPNALKQLFICMEKIVNDGRNISPSYCPRDWDHVLCWPPTAPGTFSTQKCFKEFNEVLYDSSQNVTRWCNEDGHWNITKYESCKELRIEHSDWSDKIFLCGFVVSLLALTVAVIIFLCYRELRCLRNAIHTNLMCTYMLQAVAWLMVLTIQSNQISPEWLCNTFLFIHNFATLTNFFWMFVEGLYLYMLVVRTFTIENIKLRVYLLIGWGVPVPIIVTWAVWRAYFLPNTKMEAVQCSWIKEEDIDWVFKTPPCIILVLNCGFLGRIMWVSIISNFVVFLRMDI